MPSSFENDVTEMAFIICHFLFGITKFETFVATPLCGLFGLVLNKITGSDTYLHVRLGSNGDIECDFVNASIVLGLPAKTSCD
jgi:hypothetical protein